MLRILFLGDIVGQCGRKAVMARLPDLKREREIDFAIVNGENSAGGRGITPKIAIDLLRAGAAVVTTGDHVWDQPDLIPYLPTEPRVLRPLNYPEDTPGFGSVVLETKKGKVGVINAQGRTFMRQELENPFLMIGAETTSEKHAMGRHLDGSVSAMVGTHTHVQTADEQVFPGGTAFLCDAGMCGSADSVIGSTPESVLKRFVTAMPTKFILAKSNGAIIDVDETTGKAIQIERLVEDFVQPA